MHPFARLKSCSELETSEAKPMKKTPFPFLFSCLSLVGLLVMSCGGSKRQFGEAGGGDGGTSGSKFTAGHGGIAAAGTMHSAGAGAVSVGGGDAGGGDAGDSSSGAGGSGASSGGQGTPECTALQKRCEGVCVEINDPTYGCDPTLCSTAGCPEVPGGALQCNAGQCVLGSCGTGSKKCDGRCVSVTDPAYGCGATT